MHHTSNDLRNELLIVAIDMRLAQRHFERYKTINFSKKVTELQNRFDDLAEKLQKRIALENAEAQASLF